MGKVRKMNEQEMCDVVNARCKELMQLPEVQAEMVKIHDKEGKAKAEEWVYYQALFTLFYTPAERADLLEKKQVA
tara:strand:+ start:930 stop:1154 length:225 start_codon:yes stop_codon:yes gene_type:complete